MSEPRIAIYPGSFDPPTLGHLDLIERATRVFDVLIVAVADNTEKNSLFTVSERIDMLRALTEGMDKVEIDQFRGLTVQFAQERGAVALIRGLRAVSDFEYELGLAATNRKMSPDCETICFMPSEQYMFISSRLVKEIAEFDGDLSHFVSPIVAERMREKFA